MPVDMRFEEPLVTDYLVKHLGPLTKADPVILAEYVVALLKNDKPKKELQKLCADGLADFLGPSTNSFITKLFQALEDGSIASSGEGVDSMKKSEPSGSPSRVEDLQVKHSPQREPNFSTSESVSDPDDKEVSDDDDDDDRNHKHRRREARPNSLENVAGERPLRRPDRIRNRPYENGRFFAETDPHSGAIHKGCNPSLDRDISLKFDNQNSGLMPPLRASFDSGLRSRSSHRPDPALRFDLSASVGRPPNIRGRGRGTVPWNPHDSRFNPLETLDFASKMASHGHTHPHIFMGTGLPSAASGQSPSWSSFGLIPGMSSGILDPLHPLNLQGSLQPSITPPLNLGIPRQRCRDFEERGFCLRGDMCPMEHGVNRIVVEDVQSLSQFNLPVSIPSAHALGIQSGKGSLPTANTSSSLLVNNKVLPGKSNKSGVGDDALNINGAPSAPSGAEADVYDPDQPLWNNDRPESSSALLKFPSPNINDGPFLDCDSSSQQNRKFFNSESECPGRNLSGDIASRAPSIWGRIGSGTKSETASRVDDNVTTTSYLGNEMGNVHEKAKSSTPVPIRAKDVVTEGTGIKEAASQSVPRPIKDFGRIRAKTAQRASRTLYVNGIPQKNNRRDALLSHFQKFGKVIDIYIPVSSEKAFVQFSKREEAEAALRAPDAVMGNRFIKLWWANRDNISDDSTDANNKSQQPPDLPVSSVPSQPVTNPSAAQKVNTASVGETLVPITASQKNVITNYPKAVPPAQKKLENLENLKEEIRKKQELLAQKRNDFRRQLDKLEKQTVSVNKVDVASEQSGKRQKVDKNVDITNTGTPNTKNLAPLPGQDGEDKMKKVGTGEISVSPISTAISASLLQSPGQDGEDKMKKVGTGEIPVSPISTATSASLLQSPGNVEQKDCASAELSDRFKLDYHHTSFIILPPLPSGLANVGALKEHFSSFGDLSSVVIEEPEGYTADAGLEMFSNCSARITFSSCSSAEEAFLVADHWQGHNLQVKWLEETPDASDKYNNASESLPHSTAGGASYISIGAESITSRPLSSSMENLPCGNTCEATAAVSTEESSMDIDQTNHLPESLLEVTLTSSQSGSANLSPEKRPSETDLSMA
ncbi:hypothetical protein J5N97_027647 [Dioscorea zingiberensis]|uniref:Zinc finger CCCH domain-containing protein 27 n=1 Tax=Dioscorea zingiberensis TaxID=325984 RepID=A0A9D5BXH8_9LILI|nr:hypothetical protein J5N97_027647 [Dioscorea zingiberensis]